MNELKRFLLSVMLMFACTALVYAQTEITGTVVDETGETVIGATVMEKGTTNGTVTDFDGVFTIKVNPRQPSFSPTWASLMSRCLPAMAW